ncbi:MAG: SelB C-terminal domain-containing protein [Candidatus Aminicenantes bacterium]|jgi:selenocysteine-specific elongation factor|nr:SelB C-terminal domain-containing protein [Candidatus Aminicenantes bacterium]
MNPKETKFFALNENEKLPLVPGLQTSGYFRISNKEYLFTLTATRITSSLLSQPYLYVETRLPHQVKWNDRLNGQLKDQSQTLKLKVIYPNGPSLKKLKDEKLISRLDKFSGTEEQMLLALSEEAGIRGLRQEEITDFCRLSEARLRQLAIDLEKEGQLYILEFSPLFILSTKSLIFLTEKIISYLKSYHQKRPQEIGLPIKKIKDRFSLPRKILLLALSCLSRDKKIIIQNDLVMAPGFETVLSSEEQEVISAIEKMLREKKFSSFSLEELMKKFKVHPARLNTMLELLLQKNKIVQSRDGFLLHSDWLEEIKRELAQLKKSGKSELSVGDFKKMTGLTRKYAIPLLELLDELGLTRRIGPKRIIL